MILEADMVIENAIKYVKQIFADDCSGHDYHHTNASLSSFEGTFAQICVVSNFG